jgi:hypothetical protein
MLTRHLLLQWDHAGKYLGKRARKLARPAEEKDLTRRLTTIDEMLPEFPLLLGQPGQPGYRIVMLARDEDVIGTFKRLRPDERGAVELDWKAGRAVLLAHLAYVRMQVKRWRRLAWWRAMLRPVRAVVNDHPVLTLGGISAVILGVLTWFAFTY